MQTTSDLQSDNATLEIADLPTKRTQIVSTDIKERAPNRRRGTLSRKLIDETIDRAKPKIRGCYEAALKRDPNLIVYIDINIDINKAGTVSEVSIEKLDGSPRLKECIQNNIRDLSFPAPKGGPIELVLPLRLYPKH